MTTSLATTCFVIGTLLAPVATHADDSDTDRSHPAAYVTDSIITTKIKAKLAEEKLVSLAKINVDTDKKGAVALGGTVRTQAEADRAISIARGTDGVTSVKSSIQVKKDD